jgi:hypothetical protein
MHCRLGCGNLPGGAGNCCAKGLSLGRSGRNQKCSCYSKTAHIQHPLQDDRRSRLRRRFYKTLLPLTEH